MIEYKSIQFDWHSAYYEANNMGNRSTRADIFNIKLNDHATDGWEFVSNTLVYDEVSIIVFKRERGSYR